MADDNNVLELRVRLRTKTTGPITDHSELYNNEITYGDTEKCIVVKGYDDDNTLYKFPSLDDSSETSQTATWSVFQIKSYVDEVIGAAEIRLMNYLDQEFIDLKLELESYVDEAIEAAENTAIVLPATSIIPKDGLVGCSYSTPLILNGVTPTYSYMANSSAFTIDQIGYWNIIVPDNYEDGLKNISICVSNNSGVTLTNSVFRLTAYVFNPSTSNFDTGLTPVSSNYVEFTIASIATNNILTQTITNTSQLFGPITNVNKFCVLELTLNAISDETKALNYHYLKLQYE